MDEQQTQQRPRVEVSTLLELVGAVLLLVAVAAWDWRALCALIGVALIGVSWLMGDR